MLLVTRNATVSELLLSLLDFSCRLFSTLGLRHLIVVNNSFEPVGIVSRKDIMYSKLHKDFLENVIMSSLSINLDFTYVLSVLIETCFGNCDR